MCFQTIRIQPYTEVSDIFLFWTGYEQSFKFNKEAYEYNSSDPVILDNLGYTYYKIGNIKKAEEIYRKLIGLNPIS